MTHSLGHHSGVVELMEICVLKEPVRIQYSGNANAMASRMMTIVLNTM